MSVGKADHISGCKWCLNFRDEGISWIRISNKELWKTFRKSQTASFCCEIVFI